MAAETAAPGVSCPKNQAYAAVSASLTLDQLGRLCHGHNKFVDAEQWYRDPLMPFDGRARY